MHLCDLWLWLVLEVELFAVGYLQTTFTMNRVLLTITADVKTPTGVQIISHHPVAIAQSLPRLVLAQAAHASSRHLLLRWNPFFRRTYWNFSGHNFGSF